MMLRIIYGALLGISAGALMALAGIFGVSSSNWLRQTAILLVCRMYSLGGGIDEGAESLMSSWGPSAVHSLHLMRQQDRVPVRLTNAAAVLDSDDRTHEVMRQKFTAGERIAGVHFLPDQPVLVVGGSKAGARGKIVALYAFDHEPLYRLLVENHEAYAYQSEVQAINA